TRAYVTSELIAGIVKYFGELSSKMLIPFSPRVITTALHPKCASNARPASSIDFSSLRLRATKLAASFSLHTIARAPRYAYRRDDFGPTNTGTFNLWQALSARSASESVINPFA